MKLGQKVARLRVLEGFARGLERELRQGEVSEGIREELDGKISQSYLSQIESGARRHLTSDTRSLLARFFRVHSGVTMFVWLAAIFTIVSGLQYIAQGVRFLNAASAAEREESDEAALFR